jgi:hypothetical protein
MSKAEILAELPRLAPEERHQLLQKLCELQEDDILRGHGPNEFEKELLDNAFGEFERDGIPGVPWREVLKRLLANRLA